MDILGYCEKHKQAFEFRKIPGSWVYECPICRTEGSYDTYATATTKTMPVEEWTVSNCVKRCPIIK